MSHVTYRPRHVCVDEVAHWSVAQTQCQFVVGRQRELDDLSEFVAVSAEMTEQLSEDTSNTELQEGLLS